MKYNLCIRSLHIVLASLIITQLILGFGFAFEILNFSWIIVLHKSLGLLTFFVILTLAAARIFSKKLHYDPPLPLIQYIIAKIVHLGIYISAFGMALSGLLGSMLMNYPWKIFFIIPFPEIFKTNYSLGVKIFSYHYVFATILLILVVLHITAALYHQLILKDNILARMK
ncbi:branched-chain alpha-keto acid dehydrogenase subunit E2 [Francisella halioticida]|uniref:Branched-chain alpha-keto acid dehydrogenase subunit E2 n=1 Tax=Francisella halioticida TaxID=549298 RepID=A0ABM6LWQ7_9GAMM|nr:cytochrome b/b6 domain-containing protein [Francisella halioticida]ASG67017.1 branched-chain alpha-keto acid dehydrogenase subunit E2 [Francisella halioticida]BCD92348.1 branched-chain alpha-keto acid dehydrogenase subunit E2 [Francisella halioticida]